MDPADDTPAPTIGLTGARFGGAARSRRARAGAEERPAPAAEPTGTPAAEDPAGIGLTGARFGGSPRRRRAARPAGPPPVVISVPTAPNEPTVPDEPAGPDEPLEHTRTVVRPYVLTGGRTRAGVHFAVEALITATPTAPPPTEPLEHTRIRELCRQPRSVAEVAALLGVPLGVARVLLGDLLAAGGVSVHRTVDAGGPDLALLDRVLAGLRRL